MAAQEYTLCLFAVVWPDGVFARMVFVMVGYEVAYERSFILLMLSSFNICHPNYTIKGNNIR